MRMSVLCPILLSCILLLLSGCQTPVPVAASCPPFPEPPASVKAQAATPDEKLLLEEWQQLQSDYNKALTETINSYNKALSDLLNGETSTVLTQPPAPDGR